MSSAAGRPSTDQHASTIPNETHPWLRLWGRAIDIGLLIAVAGIVLGIAQVPPMPPRVGVCFAWLLILLWVPLEALLLCYWGTTPGKWLVGSSVHDAYGMRLPYPRALRRSIDVWLFGLGGGVLPLTLAMMVVSYLRLRRAGRTWWDERLDAHVAYERIGALQLILLVLAIGGLAALAVGALVMLVAAH